MANGELPEGWGQAALKDVADYSAGRTPSRAVSQYWGGVDSVPWVSIADMEPFGKVVATRESVSARSISAVFKKPPTPKGTLLMSFKLTIGRTSVLDLDAYHNEAIISIFPRKVVDRDYLRYYLPTVDYSALQDRAIKGQTLNRDKLDRLPVILPPLSEQRAIAGVLSKLQGAVEAQDKIIATLKELKAATLAKLFREGLRGEPLKETEIGEIPESWEVVKIGDVAKVGNGSTPSRENGSFWKDGTIPWITSTKVHDLYIRSADEFVTDRAFKTCHLPLVPKGSLVVAITGQGKTLGHAALVELDTCINQHLAYLAVRDGAMLSEYILAFLQTCYDDLRQAGSSGGTTKGALTCGLLSQYLIPKPTVEEQDEIGSTFRRLHERIQGEERMKSRYQSLFQSMLHLLMTGEVRVTASMKVGVP